MMSTNITLHFSPSSAISTAQNGSTTNESDFTGSASVNRNVLGPFMAETFLYGIFFVLFVLCFYILVFKKRVVPKRVLAVTCLLFVSSTLNVVVSIYWIATREMVTVGDERMVRIKEHVFVASNALAEGILLHRCYMAWGRDKRVLAFLVFIWIANLVVIILLCFMSSMEVVVPEGKAVYLWLTFATNVVIPCLTAGRIMYTLCRAKSIFGEGIAKQYHSVVCTIAESGFLYSVYVLFVLVFHSQTLDFMLFQVVGIIPTLVIVQVALYQQVSAGKTTTTTMAAATTTHIHMENFDDIEVRNGNGPVDDRHIPVSTARV